MVRKKLTECSNCHGTEDKCKFKETGRPCRIGKAKGKFISETTIKKQERYDSEIGNLHTDYLNYMRENQIMVYVNKETGEVTRKESSSKVYSFERWLNMNGHKTLASYLRYNYKNLEQFNFTDFDTKSEGELDMNELVEIDSKINERTLAVIRVCSKKTQKEFDEYLSKFKPLIKRYKRAKYDYKHLEKQLNILEKLETVENARDFVKEVK